MVRGASYTKRALKLEYASVVQFKERCPRLLYRFLPDWVTQATIGLFMGTFVYSSTVEWGGT